MNRKRAFNIWQIFNLLSEINPSVFPFSKRDPWGTLLGNVDVEDLTSLGNHLSYFYKELRSSIEENSYVLQRIRDESFFNTFLKLIVNKDYSDNPRSLLNSLDIFFDAMLDLYYGICEMIDQWDTPTGPTPKEYAYDELKPTLSAVDGIYFIEGDFIGDLNKQIGKSLNDNGLTIKARIFNKMNNKGLFQFSRPTVDSLTLEMIIQIIKENFSKKGAITFNALKSLLEYDYLRGLNIYDFLYEFLEEEEAKIVLELNKLKPDRLKIELEPFPSYTFNHPRFKDKFSLIFNYSKHVVGLRISGINLKQVPDAIYKLGELRVLDLSFNELKDISLSIGKLHNLEILYLYNNCLTKLPESIGSLTSLRELRFNNNQLTIIPESFGNLSNLRELDLYGNKLVEIPPFIANLPSLKSLLYL